MCVLFSECGAHRTGMYSAVVALSLLPPPVPVLTNALYTTRKSNLSITLQHASLSILTFFAIRSTKFICMCPVPVEIYLHLQHDAVCTSYINMAWLYSMCVAVTVSDNFRVLTLKLNST